MGNTELENYFLVVNKLMFKLLLVIDIFYQIFIVSNKTL